MAKVEEYPLNIKEAAHRLGVSRNAVRRFVAAGKLPALMVGPLRDLRFREEDLDGFLASVDPNKLHRQLIQRIKATEPHYQGLQNLPQR